MANQDMRQDPTSAPRARHIVIEAVSPSVDCGRYPVKRVVGQPCVVEADIFRDGPAALAACIKWRLLGDERFTETPMAYLDNDRWRGEFPLLENGRYLFTIEAWTRGFVSWRDYFTKKAATGFEVAPNFAEGLAILDKILKRAESRDRALIGNYLTQLRKLDDPARAVPIMAAPEFEAAIERNEERADTVTYENTSPIIADRQRAQFGAWYEIFPRSCGTVSGRHATFREAEARLSDIRDMGFDIVYLAPIHPIGITHRKGANNSLTPSPDSPGSPWAIGNRAGGHMAVEPALGKLADFDHFVAIANGLGLEIALDFAIQCSPDHPWVSEHPQWFEHRLDGTIKYAENPPKLYQDIYPINFDTPDQTGLFEELKRIILFWIGHGIRIFRVDNPHTKPVAFWHWLISSVQKSYPEVIFLAEAFTRPKMMKTLAKIGFTQSYTYFTWRNNKQELTEYLTELSQSEMSDYFRPNFFVNTPDILPPMLQHGGRGAFKSRLVLAATLSPSYGMYSGYELCESEAIPGTEEYANSEKYEVKVRNWNTSNSLSRFIAHINAIRRTNPALQELTNLRFLTTDNDQILFYAKNSPDYSNVILVAVNLDPHNTQICTAFVPADVLGRRVGERYRVTDLLTGASYDWGERNYVRLDPQVEPAHILRVEPRS
jgi:starch synthase (maltosyl-transferring)